MHGCVDVTVSECSRLKHELKRMIISMKIKEFHILVEKCKTIERLEGSGSKFMKTHRVGSSRTKEGYHQKKSYN
ncbi:hypothetical protein CR513_50517, partial [Mucuna pruriens]